MHILAVLPYVVSSLRCVLCVCARACTLWALVAVRPVLFVFVFVLVVALI